MIYGIVGLAVAVGLVAAVKTGQHLKLVGSQTTVSDAKPGKAGAKAKGKKKKRKEVLTVDDGEEYIEQFRLCVAGVPAACERVGKGEDGGGGGPSENAPQEEDVAAAPPSGAYSDRSSGKKAAYEPFDAGVVRIALESARTYAVCRDSRSAACAQHRGKAADTVSSLKKLQERASRACRNRQHDACLIRGDLDEALGKRAEALVWFDKARTNASNVKSRCDDGIEKRAAACKAAESTLTAADERTVRIKEARIKAH